MRLVRRCWLVWSLDKRVIPLLVHPPPVQLTYNACSLGEQTANLEPLGGDLAGDVDLFVLLEIFVRIILDRLAHRGPRETEGMVTSGEGGAMALRAFVPGPLRALVYSVYGVHDWDDLQEKLVRRSPLARRLFRWMRHYPLPRIRRRRALFVHVPKNAGTTIATALYGSWIGHRTALFSRTLDPTFFSQSTRFAVLRDPVDRFTSAYWFLRNGGGSDRKVAEWFARSCQHIASLDDLLSHVEEHVGNPYGLDNVLRPQVWFLQDEKGDLLVDDLFVLGTDDARLGAFLRRRFGIYELQHLNQTHKGALVLTDRQRERIRAVYAADVELVKQIQRAHAEW